VGWEEGVAGTGVPGLLLPFGEVPALSDDIVLLLDQLLGHFLQVVGVDFGEVGRLSVLQSVDGHCAELVLDILEGSAP